MAPPRLPKLPVKVLPLTVAVPLSQMPPPKPVAVFSVKVLPLTVNVPPTPAPLSSGALSMPPPLRTAELPVKVLRMTVAVPPTSLSRPPPLVAELPEKTTSLTVSAPKLSIPPPLLLKSVPALPPAIVRPEMDTASPASTLKTRERLLPLTVSLAAPGPVIARSPVMSSSPPVRAIVPVSPESKAMVSAPGWALARATAARSEPAPLSARVGTRKVEGTMRSSSAARPGRKRFRQTSLRPVREAGRDFLFSKRCNQDSAIRNNLQERNHREERPHGGGESIRRARDQDGPGRPRLRRPPRDTDRSVARPR